MARTPSFQPRALLARPGVWGRDPDPKVRLAGSVDAAGRVAWALRQNLLVVGLNELLGYHRNTITELAEVLGGSYSQTWRKLSGATPAPYSELVRWEWLVRAGVRPGRRGPVSDEVLEALGTPSISLRAVATAGVALPGWPLPRS